MQYNLVVIGNTPEALAAAITANHLQARVAWVQQPYPHSWSTAEAIFRRSCSQKLQAYQRLAVDHTNFFPPIPPEGWDFSSLPAYGREVAAVLEEEKSPAVLSALGIDVIWDSGEFCRLPQLAFVVGKRRLYSRAYLIATGFHPAIPNVAGLPEVGYLTPAEVAQIDSFSSLPSDLVIVGETSMAMELAASLSLIGKNVTLVHGGDKILPKEEPEAAELIQAQLEAVGVRLLTGSPLVQVKQITDKKWLQAGDWAIETDEIILATAGSPNVAGLNLAGVGVKWGEKGIECSEKLRSNHPQIYVCGKADSPHLSQYEATIAVKNALFFPWLRRIRQTLPKVLFTHPPLARIGMTEAEARERYGLRVFCSQQDFKNLPQGQILGETTGFCKLVAHRNGKILGVHLVGIGAEEMMATVALAMQNKLKVKHLADLILPNFTLSEILQQTAQIWQYQRWLKQSWWQNLLTCFFRLN